MVFITKLCLKYKLKWLNLYKCKKNLPSYGIKTNKQISKYRTTNI